MTSITGKPAPRKHYGKRLEGVLEAAEELFRQKGFQQTTMEEVAREAGFSVGTLYNTVRDKEELYARVAERIGHAVLRRLTFVAHGSDSEQILLDIIRLRLCNYFTDRLFFQPYQFPAYLGIQPLPERLGRKTQELHQQYVTLLEGVYKRYCIQTGRQATMSIPIADYLEGVLTAFLCYWSGPVQSDRLSQVAQQVREALFHEIGAVASRASGDSVDLSSPGIYISRYDAVRLQELIEVARRFATGKTLVAIEMLGDALTKARVVNPREVPPDVVTMNSKISLHNLGTDESLVHTLVFPKDADLRDENLSILDPLGMVLLGRRTGEMFTVDVNRTEFRVDQILYQPESSGDFHL